MCFDVQFYVCHDPAQGSNGGRRTRGATGGSSPRIRAVGGTIEVAAPSGAASIIGGLCRLFNCFGSRQLMQERNSAFGMGCGMNDGAGVVLQHLDPTGDVAGMIGARLNR